MKISRAKKAGRNEGKSHPTSGSASQIKPNIATALDPRRRPARVEGLMLGALGTAISVRASQARYGSSAKILVGAPVPLPIFIGIQKMVAPFGGSLSAFATFSNPGRFAPSQI